MKMFTQKCKVCSKKFEIEDDAMGMFRRFIVFCPLCRDEIDAARRKEARESITRERLCRWQSMCPPIYTETVFEKLPNQDSASKSLLWEPSAKGLMLFGKTRTGKSRVAWLICKKAILDGLSVEILDSMAGFEYAARFSAGPESAGEWVMKKSRSGVLFFDDAFKVKLTDSFEAAIFAIVDYRMAHKLPILATSNDTGSTLAGRMSIDRGQAFVARLKEMCDVIQF